MWPAAGKSREGGVRRPAQAGSHSRSKGEATPAVISRKRALRPPERRRRGRAPPVPPSPCSSALAPRAGTPWTGAG
eukprot:scaffold7382_cov406-Prasinococcus_capsulatus_cf.AAC.23